MPRSSRGRHGRAGDGLDRLWAKLAFELQQPRNQAAAGIFVLGLVLAAIVSLVTVTGGSTAGSGRNKALPPTPPSPVASVLPVPPSLRPGPPAPSASKKKADTPPKPIHCSSKPAPSGGGAGPAEICIPALGVDASVMQLGLNNDRTVEVPPLSRVGDAGWYKYSAPPGNIGPTVILGHVDSAQYGAGVFFRLGQLHAGNKVIVYRGDGMIATFRVDRVVQIAKSRFPTNAVYGATSRAAIRLVTCGGRYNTSTGGYDDNIIVYGTLSSLRRG